MLMSASIAIYNVIDNFSSNIRILFINYYFFLDSLGINESHLDNTRDIKPRGDWVGQLNVLSECL
jgi:hypothetical protein